MSFSRFSSDVSKVDDSLPFILNIFLAQCVTLAGLLAVLCYSAPPLALLLLPLGWLYRCVVQSVSYWVECVILGQVCHTGSSVSYWVECVILGQVWVARDGTSLHM
jgi:hypothetical protein